LREESKHSSRALIKKSFCSSGFRVLRREHLGFAYYAIQNGEVIVVVPVDKLSIIVTVISSYFVFKEKLSKKAFAGICLMVVGTLLMVFFK